MKHRKLASKPMLWVVQHVELWIRNAGSPASVAVALVRRQGHPQTFIHTQPTDDDGRRLSPFPRLNNITLCMCRSNQLPLFKYEKDNVDIDRLLGFLSYIITNKTFKPDEEPPLNPSFNNGLFWRTNARPWKELAILGTDRAKLTLFALVGN